MPYHVKFRPKDFKHVIGNKEAKQALKKVLTKEEPVHSYLITGPSGCGKTTLARIAMNMLGIKGRDLAEINSADFRGIDTIREINRQSQYMPVEGARRAWLIDECHKLTDDAQNALLKILEEPPDYVYFFLCTTNPSKLLPTIKGRCSHFQVTTLSEKKIMTLLTRVVDEEEEQVDRKILRRIAEHSMGRPREALQMLEQIVSVEPKQRKHLIKNMATEEIDAINLCRSLIKNEGWKATRMILSSLKEQKKDPETLRRMVLSYCSSTILNKPFNQGIQIGLIMDEFNEPFYDTGWPELILACFKIHMERGT